VAAVAEPHVIQQAALLLPGLQQAPGPVRRSIKCVVVPATLGGRPLVVKALFRAPAVWRWYLQRERAVLELFARVAPPLGSVRVPRLLAASDDLLVLERMPGEPLAARRHDARIRGVDPSTWEALLAAREGLRRWSPRGLAVPAPDGEATALMRRRVLEDPSAPLAWIVEGIDFLRTAGLLEELDAAAMSRALASHGTTSFSHGDLLPRNVLRDGTGALALVDWECAGEHADAWDAALLWVFAPSWARERLAQDHSASGASRAAFLACVGFALTREMFYRNRRGAEDPVARRLSRERASTLAELRECNTSAARPEQGIDRNTT
jgi:hypothetical protein